MSKLTSGNNCENLGDTLTTCNIMVHNEGAGNGCAYSGGDYNGFFGVSSSVSGYTDQARRVPRRQLGGARQGQCGPAQDQPG
jgi:hypothetical protein